MRLIIENNAAEVAKWAANHIVERINAHKGPKPFVLGLPTGGTPLGTYKELLSDKIKLQTTDSTISHHCFCSLK